jgi:hypothetical protein
MGFRRALNGAVALGTIAALATMTAGEAFAGGRGHYHRGGSGCCSSAQWAAFGLGVAALGGLTYLAYTARPSYAYYYAPPPAYYPAYYPYYAPYAYYYAPAAYYLPPAFYYPPTAAYAAEGAAPAYPAPSYYPATYGQPQSYLAPATYDRPATAAVPAYPAIQAAAMYRSAPVPAGSTAITDNALNPPRER